MQEYITVEEKLHGAILHSLSRGVQLPLEKIFSIALRCCSMEKDKELSEGIGTYMGHIEILLKFPEFCPSLLFDEKLMELAINNVLFNAIENSPQEKSVELEFSPDEKSYRFSVLGRGSGIPEEVVPLIFKKFYYIPGSPSKGTGLGLAIVQSVVTIHQGKIDVRSREGGGTIFSLIFPCMHVQSKARCRRVKLKAPAFVARKKCKAILDESFLLKKIDSSKMAHRLKGPTAFHRYGHRRLGERCRRLKESSSLNSHWGRGAQRRADLLNITVNNKCRVLSSDDCYWSLLAERDKVPTGFVFSMIGYSIAWRKK